MEIQGKVIAVLEAKSGIGKASGNAWMAQEYVLETHEQYPKKICFEVFGEEKIRQFNIQIGEELTVFFDIMANEWQGRYYNRIRAWRVDRYDPNNPAQQNPIPQAGSIQPFDAPQQAPATAMPPQQPAAPQQASEPFNPQAADEELPF